MALIKNLMDHSLYKSEINYQEGKHHMSKIGKYMTLIQSIYHIIVDEECQRLCDVSNMIKAFL